MGLLPQMVYAVRKGDMQWSIAQRAKRLVTLIKPFD